MTLLFSTLYYTWHTLFLYKKLKRSIRSKLYISNYINYDTFLYCFESLKKKSSHLLYLILQMILEIDHTQIAYNLYLSYLLSFCIFRYIQCKGQNNRKDNSLKILSILSILKGTDNVIYISRYLKNFPSANMNSAPGIHLTA